MAFANSVTLYNCKLNHNGLFVCDFGGSGATRDSVMSGTNSLATVKFTYSSCTYMRKDKYIMVDENADVLDAAGVNYCRYINNDFSSNHFFYAFVIKIEYVAPKTSKLYITTDCFTTYFHKIIPNQCLVEREHVADDRMWKNTQAEQVQANKFNYREVSTPGWDNLGLDYNYFGELCDNYYGYIYLSELPDDWRDASVVNINPYNDGFINGVEPGGFAFIFEISQDIFKYIMYGLQDLELDINAVKELGAFPKSAVSYMTPVFLDAPWEPFPGKEVQFYTFNTTSSGTQISFTRPYTMNEVYTPHNRKLLQSPYTTYIFTNSAQQVQELEPELFADYQDGQVYFSAYQLGADSAQIVAIPKDYCGRSEDWAHAIASDTFLTLDAISSSSQQYKALNKNMLGRTIINVAGTAIGGLVAGGVGAKVGGLVSNALAGASAKAAGPSSPWMMDDFSRTMGGQRPAEINNAAGTMIGSYLGNSISGIASEATGYFTGLAKADSTADQVVGSINTTTMGYFANGGSKPRIYIKQARDVEARAIDSYFDKCGYNVYTVKTPQWNSRPKFNFVKTQGANVGGEIPQSDKEIINSLLDSGLTVWHNVADYGIYDGANNLAPTR